MAYIYQVWNVGEAHLCASVVNDPAMADLWVYRASSLGMASGDACWHITTDREMARTWVYFGSMGEAQLRIYFVSDRGQAGWRKSHPWKGRLR